MQIELLAQAVDSLNLLAHDYRRKGPPEPVPRPAPAGQSRASTPAEVAAFFGGGP